MNELRANTQIERRHNQNMYERRAPSSALLFHLFPRAEFYVLHLNRRIYHPKDGHETEWGDDVFF